MMDFFGHFVSAKRSPSLNNGFKHLGLESYLNVILTQVS